MMARITNKIYFHTFLELTAFSGNNEPIMRPIVYKCKKIVKIKVMGYPGLNSSEVSDRS